MSMFENLSDRLERSFKILKGQGKITEINVAETLKDVRKALMEADVSYKVAKSFVDTVKQKAMGQNVINAIKPKELMVKIVHDELVALMGGNNIPLATPQSYLCRVCRVRVRPPSQPSWPNASKAKTPCVRCWWPATYIAPQQSTS